MPGLGPAEVVALEVIQALEAGFLEHIQREPGPLAAAAVDHHVAVAVRLQLRETSLELVERRLRRPPLTGATSLDDGAVTTLLHTVRQFVRDEVVPREAEIMHSPWHVAEPILNALRERGSALFTVAGHQEAVSFWEKAVQPFVEKIITTAKRGDVHSRRLINAKLGHDRIMADTEATWPDDEPPG